MKAHLANRWLGISVIAALLTVAGLVGVAQIPPAHAQESNINADCEFWATNPDEGENYRVTISADDGDENARIAGWWQTVAHPATSNVPGAATVVQDYVEVRSQWQEGTGSVTGEFSTTEDEYAERLELLTIRFQNAVEGGENVECEIAIWDDDVGVTDVDITSSPADGHTYRAGESIEIALTFNRHVEVSGEVLLDLRVGSSSDASHRVARYHRHTGAIVYFRYQVQPGDSDDNGISLDGGYIDENGFAHGIGGSGRLVQYWNDDPFSPWWHGIGDQAGHQVDAPVYATDTEIISIAANGETYGVGETIEIALTYNAPVQVEGNVLVHLRMGTGSWWPGAAYNRGSGTNTLVFSYQVQAGDLDTDGVSLDGSYVDAHGVLQGYGGDGTIKLAGTDIEASQRYPGVSPNRYHKVDGIKPTISSATVAPNGSTVTVTFTEAIQVSPLLQYFIDNEGIGEGIHQFILSVLNVDVNHAWPSQSTFSTVSGNTITVYLDSPAHPREWVQVRYDSVFSYDAPGILMDLAGNPMANFGPTRATNNSTRAFPSGSGNVVLGVRELTITEGDSATYTVRLASQPTGDVSVAINSNRPPNVSISHANLTFTRDNWNLPQTVTVSSSTDDNTYGYWVGIRHTASGSGFTGEDTLKVLMQE